MNDTKRRRLIEAGIDIDDALERFLGNEQLYEESLMKFLKDDSYTKLEEALKVGDRSAASSAAVALWGVSSNLSINELSRLLTCQSVMIRSDLEEAKRQMPRIAKAYRKALDAIGNC